jgi:hypothetical protein
MSLRSGDAYTMQERSVQALLQQAVINSEAAQSGAQDACIRAGMAYQAALDALELAEKALHAAREAADGTLLIASVMGSDPTLEP